MVQHHVRLLSQCRQILRRLVQGQASGMLPRQLGHHFDQAQLQRIIPRPGVTWTTFSQYDLLSILVQDQDQRNGSAAPVTAELGTAVIQLQLELLRIKAAKAVVISYLVTG